MVASSEFQPMVRKPKVGILAKEREFLLMPAIQACSNGLLDPNNPHHGRTGEPAPQKQFLKIVERRCYERRTETRFNNVVIAVFRRKYLNRNKLSTRRPRELDRLHDLGFDSPNNDDTRPC